ncbi:hypothetical protein BFJ66_g8674 [Fusarium oxysporum f. sp. cepae]|uniref:Rhodopsin domain-containing protein n=1 Tax=Fusarium oxysporum f. sp. cepae TaxID=396571 RepID=A0A3L6MZI4_FUSOX|nr:hypothetical protein BFJ65_g15890 [Fusarium oxysporum f. sp. cepae]RKK46123.1 hypothetical protein BFJ66_g8674 [Fusarium oxysporum f. sp. cepae]RKK50570.1 hypothetical protein BFJ67_g6357 [Fusarium oxysporum f. sp. cepae]
MDNNTSIGIQAVLLILALVVLVLRCWANYLMKQALFSVPDILAWLGWVFSLGWFICSTLALRILIDNPAVGSELIVNSVEYLKIVLVAEYFFDTGIYFPKISIVLFYWKLIPGILGSLRRVLLAISIYLGCALLTSVLVNTLICIPFSDNWSIENQLKSAWNSYASFCVQWGLNFSTDLLIFFYPFFLLKHLKLHRKQQVALIGIFSLGAITLIVSLSRFIAYNATDFELDDQSGNTLSLAEMSTAVIVVCLPGLRRFIMRSKTSTNRSSSNQPSGYGVHTKITGRGQNTDTSKGQIPPSQYAKWGVRDDEIELVTHIRVSHELVNPDDTRSATGQSAISQNFKV